MSHDPLPAAFAISQGELAFGMEEIGEGGNGGEGRGSGSACSREIILPKWTH